MYPYQFSIPAWRAQSGLALDHSNSFSKRLIGGGIPGIISWNGQPTKNIGGFAANQFGVGFQGASHAWCQFPPNKVLNGIQSGGSASDADVTLVFVYSASFVGGGDEYLYDGDADGILMFLRRNVNGNLVYRNIGALVLLDDSAGAFLPATGATVLIVHAGTYLKQNSAAYINGVKYSGAQTDSYHNIANIATVYGSSVYPWQRNFNGIGNAFYVLKGNVTDDEAISLTNNPFQLFTTQGASRAYLFSIEPPVAATKTLTPTLFGSSPDFLAHTLTLGSPPTAQNLTATLFGSSPGFFNATITPQPVMLFADTLASSPGFFAHTLSQGGAPTQSLAASILASSPGFFAHTLSQGSAPTQSLAASILASSPGFFVHSLVGGVQMIDVSAARYVVTGRRRVLSCQRVNWFSPKTPDEIVTVVFDFKNLVSSIDSIDSFTVSVRNGVDGNPSAMLIGSALASGTAAAQLIRGGVDGVTYLVTAIISKGPEKFSLAGCLPVRRYS